METERTKIHPRSVYLLLLVILFAMATSVAVRSQTANPNPVCYGNPINLFCNLAGCDSPGATISWSNESGSWTSTQKDPVILPGTTGYASDKFYLSVQYSPPPGGFSGGRVTVVINQPLPASVSITVSANQVCFNTPVTFTATPVNGGTSPTYQWKKNGTAINGATNSTYTYNPFNQNVITCVMTSSGSCVSGSPATSNAITMVVYPMWPVSVTIAASANPVCTGTPVIFTATPVNGGTPAYQWKLNSVNVPGATGSTYTYVPLTGDVVKCEMTTSIMCPNYRTVISNAITMIVNGCQPPTVQFDGITCTAGNNTGLTLSGDSLIITNLGADSCKVLLNLDSNQIFDYWYRFNNQPGAKIHWKAKGSLNNVPGQTISLSTIEQINDTLQTLTCSMTNITQLVGTASLHGTPLFQFPVNSGVPIPYKQCPPNPDRPPIIDFHYDYSLFGLICWWYWWACSVSITFNGEAMPSMYGLSFDALTVSPAFGNQIPSRITSAELTLANSANLTVNRSIGILAGNNIGPWQGTPVQMTCTTKSGAAYQWQKDTLNIPGATSSSYSATSEGKYNVKIAFNNKSYTSSALPVYYAGPYAYAGADTAITDTVYTLSGASASNYSSIYWTTSGVGYFNDPTALHPIYYAGQDVAGCSVELCLTATPLTPSAPVVMDCMSLEISGSTSKPGIIQSMKRTEK